MSISAGEAPVCSSLLEEARRKLEAILDEQRSKYSGELGGGAVRAGRAVRSRSTGRRHATVIGHDDRVIKLSDSV